MRFPCYLVLLKMSVGGARFCFRFCFVVIILFWLSGESKRDSETTMIL